MGKVIWSELTTKQIKSLKLLKNETIQKLVTSKLRGLDDDISKDEINIAWEWTATRSKEVLGLVLIGPTEYDGQRVAICKMIAKELI